MSNDSSMAGPASGLSREETAVLRAELAAVRAEAERELERLREELEAVRDLARPERDVDMLTESIALQQELDTLRNTLREKERVIDVTAAQCRRLEDELEDHHLAFDGLKQDLERKKLSLAAAREQVARLTAERQELEAHCQSLMRAAAAVPEAPSAPVPLARGPDNRRLLMGLGAGMVIGAGAMALVAGVSPGAPDVDLSALDAPVAVPRAAAPAAARGAGSAPAPAPAAPPEPSGETSYPPPAALRNVRDQLAGGNQGPLMIAIQGGTFTMGKLKALPSDDEGPAHRVDLAGFLIGATEVTYDDYDLFVRATGGRFPSDFGWGRGRRPVVDVSWEEARAYAEWLSRETGRRYRLPSEAEWEYAAAAGARTPFWWGFRLEQGRAVCFDCATMWDNRSTAPAGTFDPNPLGLYDTAGNAMEWVEDCYHPSYVGSPANGRAWVDPGCGFRVARGGAFSKPSSSMRSTARQGFDPNTRLNMLGFRVARDE